ncbi:MAG TPA: hypothetical protein VFM60_06610 [Salinimicrobium sp.]|nr:hypothetical protein [Salinimicrobium sp.]
MKPASVRELKQELRERSSQELLEICLRLSKFKKENKELLTYLLFDSSDESTFIANVKKHLDEEFDDINRSNVYFIKKRVRKVLRTLKKYARYSSKKETEVELLLYFCEKLYSFSPSIKNDKVLRNLYERQLLQIRKIIPLLHEDLQHDYSIELNELELTKVISLKKSIHKI